MYQNQTLSWSSYTIADSKMQNGRAYRIFVGSPELVKRHKGVICFRPLGDFNTYSSFLLFRGLCGGVGEVDDYWVVVGEVGIGCLVAEVVVGLDLGGGVFDVDVEDFVNHFT